MPDPIDELEGFTMSPLTPAPASEVRRRGDRIRRRNRALSAAGGLAVVAAIVAPIAIATAHNPASQAPLPANQPPGGWVQTVPTGFDITALPQDAQFQFTVNRNGPGVDDIRVCGERAFATGSKEPAGPAVDTRGATWSEAYSEATSARTLAVYADDTVAQRVLAGLEDAVTGCPEEPRSGAGGPFVYDAVDLAIPGADDSFVFTRQVQLDKTTLSELTAFEAVRVGNAIYLATSSTSAGGDQASGTPVLLMNQSAPVLAQMCVFSVEGCGAQDQPSVAVDEPTGLAGPVPDGFPLEKGLPTDPQGGVGLEGPSRDLDLAVYNVENTLRACGTAPSGLPRPVDTLYAGYRTPAEGILRQLMTFESTDAAQAYAEGLLAPFAACPEDDLGGGATKVYEITPEQLGDYAASSVMRVEVDGEPGVGYQVVQVVRVGQAVLQTLVNNDGDQLDGNHTPEQVRTMYLENSQSVVDAMS